MKRSTIIDYFDKGLCISSASLATLLMLSVPLSVLRFYDHIIPAQSTDALLWCSVAVLLSLCFSMILLKSTAALCAIHRWNMAPMVRVAGAVLGAACVALLTLLVGPLALLPLAAAIMLLLLRHNSKKPADSHALLQANIQWKQQGWAWQLSPTLTARLAHFRSQLHGYMQHFMRHQQQHAWRGIISKTLPMACLLLLVWALAEAIAAETYTLGMVAACLFLSVRIMSGLGSLAIAAPVQLQKKEANTVPYSIPEKALMPARLRFSTADGKSIQLEAGEIAYLPMHLAEANYALHTALHNEQDAMLRIHTRNITEETEHLLHEVMPVHPHLPLLGDSVQDALCLHGQLEEKAVIEALQTTMLMAYIEQLPEGLHSNASVAQTQLPEVVWQMLAMLPCLLLPARSYIILLPETPIPTELYQAWFGWLNRILSHRTVLILGQDHNMHMLATQPSASFAGNKRIILQEGAACSL